MIFNSFEDLKKHFVEPDIFGMLDVIFKSTTIQNKAIDFNHQQLQEGKDVNDQTIKTIGGNPYRPYTIAIKQSKGQPTGVVTLKDSGDFYKTFKFKFVSNGYEIIADFNKPDGDIRDNFSSNYDFLGLEYTYLYELTMEYIYPVLSKMIKEQYL